MSDMDKQVSATSVDVKPEAETSDVALAHIVEGFKRFRSEVFPEQEELFKKLATAQQPRAMFITC
ncbi:MAG: carbonic anhydrase, partial [Pseudomonas caspiana]